MSKLLDELRKKYPTAKDAIKALGLDGSLLDTENNMTKPTKFANFALQLASAIIRPMIAKDAKIDLMPIFKDLTTKNFDAKKVKIAMDGALKGKLAKDAEPNMGHVATMLDHIGSMAKPETADASVSPEQHNAMEAAAHGESNLGIPPAVGKEFVSKDAGMENLKGFLKEKGMADDDINAACDMLPKAAAAKDESPEEKAKREEEEKKKAAEDSKKAEDAKKANDETVAKAEEEKKKAEDAMKDMVTKPAMDAAIKAAVKMERDRATALTQALDAARPVVGELAMSFDSAEQVYRHVAKMKGVNGHDTLAADALPTIISLLPKAGRSEERRGEVVIAQDADTVSSFNKMFPGAEKIGLGTA